MPLRVHAPGCLAHEIGVDRALADAIADQAQIIADDTAARTSRRVE